MKLLLLTVSLIMTAGTTKAQDFFYDGAVDPSSKAVMAKAEQDIEKYRKDNFTFVLIDSNNNPVKGVKVKVELDKHQFNFGTNLFGLSKYPDENPLKRTALQTIKDIFNQVVVCDYWFNPRDKMGDKQPFKDVEWAKANNMRMRLHCILYELRSETFPHREYTTDECWKMIEERIKYIGKHFNGIISEFDVINEVISKFAWEKNSPNAFWKLFPNFPEFRDSQNAVKVYELARKYIPDGKLVCLENPMPSVNSKLYLEVIDYWKELLANGADIDIIATQCHFFDKRKPYPESKEFTMASISEGLDLLQSLGKPIAITEFTGPSRNGEMADPVQRDKLWTLTDEENAAWQVNFYKLAFSKPYIFELVRWNHIDGGCGRAADGGIITPSGVKHQVYYDLKKLIKETWHTKYEGKSNSKGEVSFRGFYGDYKIEVPGYETADIMLYDTDKGIVKVMLNKYPN